MQIHVGHIFIHPTINLDTLLALAAHWASGDVLCPTLYYLQAKHITISLSSCCYACVGFWCYVYCSWPLAAVSAAMPDWILSGQRKSRHECGSFIFKRIHSSWMMLMLSFKESCNIIEIKEPHLNTAPGPILYLMHFWILNNYCFLLLSCVDSVWKTLILYLFSFIHLRFNHQHRVD